jgi:hypothetical protein
MDSMPATTSTADFSAGLAEGLAWLPDVEVLSVDQDMRIDGRQIDMVVSSRVKGRPVQFLVEVKAGGYPRDVRQAIWQLDGLRRIDEHDARVPMLAAPAISAASRELLQRDKVAYWDAGGSLYIELPWALYWIDRPVPSGRQRVLRNVYRGSAAQVLHTLLLEPGRSWHVTQLAERAQVSVSTVHQVCTVLEAQLWMDKAGKGPRAVRRLSNPGALLDAWADAHLLTNYAARRFHRWMREPAELLYGVTGALDRAGVEYALTLSSGAALVAPHLMPSEQVWVLLSANDATALGGVVQASDLQPVDEGETVTFLLTRQRSPLLFRRHVWEYSVASDVQLYLDLWAWPRRGKEQAKHLRAERLGY